MFIVMRGWFVINSSVWDSNRSYLPRYGTGQHLEEMQEEKDSKAMANLLLW
jgi:hypothetical protein